MIINKKIGIYIALISYYAKILQNFQVMDLVSIILPYYKKKDFINLTIESLLKQTYKNFEIIIVDDEQSLESKDTLANIIKIDPRINLINNKINLGAGYSRNVAIKIAKGKYLAFLDDDDIWLKDKLNIQISEMEKLNYKLSSTEGYFGDGVYNKKTKYELYTKNITLKISNTNTEKLSL